MTHFMVGNTAHGLQVWKEFVNMLNILDSRQWVGLQAVDEVWD